MKLVLFVFTITLICACNEESDCEVFMYNEYPAIDSFIQSNNLEKTSNINCETDIHKSKYLYGITETNENGYFFNDSLQFETLKITSFSFKDELSSETNNSLLYKFICYEFDSEEDKYYFENFIPSITRKLNHSKEMHAFFKSNGSWFMYYYGFP